VVRLPELGAVEFLEQRQLETGRALESGVERAPGSLGRWGDRRRAGIEQALGRGRRIADLEGDPDVTGDPATDFDLVDVGRVARIGQLERRAPGIEDRDPAAVGRREGTEVRQPERITMWARSPAGSCVNCQ
jgi:hypothetical protein